MRDALLNPYFASLASLKGVGEKNFPKLAELVSGEKVINLLFHLPYNILNRKMVGSILETTAGEIATLKLKITDFSGPKNRFSKAPFKVLASDGSDYITLPFFNIPASYIEGKFKVGDEIVASGKISNFDGMVQMEHPDYFLPAKDEAKIKTHEPVYPLTYKISGKFMQKVMAEALAKTPNVAEWIDGEFLKKQQFPAFHEALIKVHTPKEEADLLETAPARRRLAYDEILAHQLALSIVRNNTAKKGGMTIPESKKLVLQLISSLPYQLTGAQKRVFSEISENLASSHKMMRLIQGDVGCGKTIVAVLAMLSAVEAGYQAAIMAPTDILASQHFESISELLLPLGIRAISLTGRDKGKKREEKLEALHSGEAQIIVGTHALFSSDVEYDKLGLIIIDEQHRFGVEQRVGLATKSEKANLLFMSATPIPRSLAMTMYGDLDISIIDELPPSKKPIDTRVMSKDKISELVAGIARAVALGEKVYWVCPLIEQSEKLDITPVLERYDDLLQHFPKEKIAFVHGKMKGEEKDKVLAAFADPLGELQILISTTVIEVGINVPEATVMVIEHAERFGLAALHQLRGRVGRGSKPASCILLYAPPLSATAKERLSTMRETQDGFKIAEADFKLRGFGEILGTKQSGVPDFRFVQMGSHLELFLPASQQVKLILNSDAHLESEQGKNLRNLLYLFEKDKLIRFLQA